MFEKPLRLVATLLLLTVALTVGCPAQQSEEQALQSLRQMTSDGKLPPEDFVAGLESRFAGKKTGALAKLLHARIRFENNDFAGAAAMLNSDVFAKKTKVADHALWLRGLSLLFAHDPEKAGPVFQKLVETYPESIFEKEARLGWATEDLASNTPRTAEILNPLLEQEYCGAFVVMGRGAEAQGDRENAVRYYRKAYFCAPKLTGDPRMRVIVDPSDVEVKLKTFYGDDLQPRSAEEILKMAERDLSAKNYADAAAAYSTLAANFPTSVTPQTRLKQLTASANSGKMADAQAVLNSLPNAAKEREEGYRQLVLGYAKAKMWPQARTTADEMRQKFPNSSLVAKTFIDAGVAARDAKNKTEEAYFFNTAVAAFPNAIEVAQAQFETAWMQHENKNFAISSQMFVDHLSRYADKDTTNRGKAGYWAARDSERAGKMNEACALYDAVMYRYSANWYGYLASNRLAAMKNQGQCNSSTPPTPTITKAVTNLKTITVAAETATDNELSRAEKSEELSTIGLFDWAIDELQEAKTTADKSPKINLALAQYYRLKGDNVNALLALAKSYPDYSQMFPEEMGREEWNIFYPLTNWSDIKKWSQNRGLDPYQVAGFIRQETIFDPRAKSHADAFGLMQLLLPTARTVARNYGTTIPNSGEDLYNTSLNIELGTAYLKDQFAKFGRIEYVAVAYNAGPNRVNLWRASLPAEIDEFVEAIPFKETKGYVQGIIRNTAQYRRLYDENGNFKPNVGTKPLRGEIDAKPRDQFVAENPEVLVDDGS
jgi:soluble lytic murein transglycosylase